MVTGTFAFFCTRSGRFKCFDCRFLEWIDTFPDDRRSFSTRLKSPREKFRMRDVGRRFEEVCQQQLVSCLQIDAYADSGSKKRR